MVTPIISYVNIFPNRSGSLIPRVIKNNSNNKKKNNNNNNTEFLCTEVFNEIYLMVLNLAFYAV